MASAVSGIIAIGLWFRLSFNVLLVMHLFEKTQETMSLLLQATNPSEQNFALVITFIQLTVQGVNLNLDSCS